MRRSVYCTASFSICSLRRTKVLIIYPEFPLDYKLATLPEKMLQYRCDLQLNRGAVRRLSPQAPESNVTKSRNLHLNCGANGDAIGSHLNAKCLSEKRVGQRRLQTAVAGSFSARSNRSFGGYGREAAINPHTERNSHVASRNDSPPSRAQTDRGA